MNRKSTTAAAALTALADPTRRQIFERLRPGPRAVGDLARGVPVSRPAVSQHLAVLKAAGLVRDVADGRRRMYEIDPKGLGAIRAWLDDMWDRSGSVGSAPKSDIIIGALDVGS